jgi:hypothetical protein
MNFEGSGYWVEIIVLHFKVHVFLQEEWVKHSFQSNHLIYQKRLDPERYCIGNNEQNSFNKFLLLYKLTYRARYSRGT